MKLASTPIDQLNAVSGTGGGGGNSNGGDATATIDTITTTIATVTTASAFMLSFRQEAGIQTGRKPPSPNHHSTARHPQ